MRQLVIVAAVLALAVAGACKKKDGTPTPSDKPVEGAIATGQEAITAVSSVALPAPGAADAIEPPTRDILPGMTVAEATAKGAKLDGTSSMDWKPNLELSVDTASGLIEDLQVTYPKKDFEALSAKWGKPTFSDDVWLGANWMASLNGCASGSECTVTWTRSPLAMLGNRPVPPLGLAKLQAGMSAAQAKAATGLPFGDDQLHFGYPISAQASFDEDRLEYLMLSHDDGSLEEWLPILTKLWGPPTQLEDETVWINTQDHWLAQHGKNGYLVRFTPLITTGELLAKTGTHSLLATAAASLGKLPTAVSWPLYDAKDDSFVDFPAELSLEQTERSFRTGDDGKVDTLVVRIYAAGEQGAKTVEKLLSGAWGPIKTVKDKDDNESRVITVDGFKVEVESDDGDNYVTFYIRR